MVKIDCKKCGKVKDVSCFNKNPDRKRGYHVWCKECVKEYDHNRHAKDRVRLCSLKKQRRLEVRNKYQEYKKTLKCSVCGEKDWICLDFHHTDPNTKDGTIGAIVRSWSFERIVKEIEKCNVLCANCHRKLHRDIVFNS